MARVQLRSGNYGDYWGSTYSNSGSLNSQRQEINATYIWNALQNEGWTVNAVAGMLGNMQRESAINPGRWQSDSVGNMSGGYGLVQWTPATKYINWIGIANDPSTMDNNLSRILWELSHNRQWIKTKAYPITFKEFTESTETPEYLASAFLKNYERAGVSAETQRRRNARRWYDFLGGITPEEKPKRKKFPFVLYARKLRNKY